jgi:short-subunit dehydrogenase
MKETVLITGASSGIGLELAKCFAADKSNLILVARNTARWKRSPPNSREHKLKSTSSRRICRARNRRKRFLTN